MLAHRMSGFHGPVYLALRPSALCARVLVAAHVLALAAVLVCYPTSLARTLLLLAITLNGAISLHQLLRPRADAVVAVLLGTYDAWQVSLADGRVLSARLARPPYVSVYLTALSLRVADGRVRHVLILPDNANADAFRRLRVRLRHPRENATSTTPP